MDALLAPEVWQGYGLPGMMFLVVVIVFRTVVTRLIGVLESNTRVIGENNELLRILIQERMK